MARTPKPWYRAERDDWVVYIAGQKRSLAKGKANKAKALKEFHRLMAEEKKAAEAPATGATVGDLFDFFLEHVERDLAPLTLEFYERHLKRFCRYVGKETPAAT